MDEIERRWLIDMTNVTWPDKAVLDTKKELVAQIYLEAHPPVVSRVRSSTPLEDRLVRPAVMTHTVKMPGPEMGHNLEIEREIDSDEFHTLVENYRDPRRAVVTKIRSTFRWNQWVWELDEFVKGISILECELPTLSINVHTPPWLKVIREITDEPGWSNFEMSDRDWTEPS